ncbi:serine protease inhibitor 2-like [Sabethes cyaneus]|uniref:serine protease inhibitor 2-like n=1 Tax=Sabethes cyaneus TaxID=53552 RepID=UPI00237E402B|nr:serine protease inhibitor 2-like [Sabethes cyaneus]
MTQTSSKLLRGLLLISIICVGHNGKSFAKRQGNVLKSRFEQDEPQPTRDDDFDWKLIKNCFQNEQSNAAVSTFLVKYLLNMIYEGASIISQTQQELSEPLGRVPGATDTPNCVNLMAALQAGSKRLHVSSRMFADQLISVSQKYASTISMYYNASVEHINFGQPEKAVQQINDWISAGTQGQIRELVSLQQIRGSILLLASTIYFKGLWRNVFPEAATVSQPFRTGDGRTINVPSMKQITYLYYCQSQLLNAQFLRLPYEEGRFSMILMLPNENIDLNQFVRTLSAEAIHQAIGSMDEVEVKLQLPRFTINYGSSLKDTLKQLGIRRIFEDNAELGGISRGGGLPVKVSDVFQKTVIVVDEKGSTASSAAGSSLVYTSLTYPENFIVDRPFAFFIEEESTGTLLFAGKVEDPMH